MYFNSRYDDHAVPLDVEFPPSMSQNMWPPWKDEFNMYGDTLLIDQGFHLLDYPLTVRDQELVLKRVQDSLSLEVCRPAYNKGQKQITVTWRSLDFTPINHTVTLTQPLWDDIKRGVDNAALFETYVPTEV